MAQILSPMPGKVCRVNVAVGDKVELDQEILVLESMKMEVGVFADEAGEVKAILVKEGDAVNDGDPVLELA